VLGILDRLGDPADIVDAEQPVAMAPVDLRSAREWGAIILLLLGGLIFGVGWIVGLILLWSSHAWSTAEKWIARS